MPQPLATAPERAQLLANGEARAAGRAIDPVPVVRLFGAAELRLGGDKGDVVRIERTDGVARRN